LLILPLIPHPLQLFFYSLYVVTYYSTIFGKENWNNEKTPQLV
jgi:hypothetical protein